MPQGAMSGAPLHKVSAQMLPLVLLALALKRPNRPVRTRMPGGSAGEQAEKPASYADLRCHRYQVRQLNMFLVINIIETKTVELQELSFVPCIITNLREIVVV